MEQKIDEAIVKMAEMVVAQAQPDSAMKFSQAALNLAHVRTLVAKEEPVKRGPGRPPGQTKKGADA